MIDIKKFIKSLRILNAADNTKAVDITISNNATTNTKLTLTAKQTKNTSLDFPDLPGLVTSDEIVTGTSTATLKNKNLEDSTTNIIDNLDPSKKIKFDVGGATMTTTLIVSSPTVNQTIMIPDATDTLVARNTTDTLTNKTLTSPVINTPDINMGTIDGATINNSPIGQTIAADGAFTTLSGTSISVAGDPVVTLTAPQTVSNKTLTAPIVNNPTITGGAINDTQIGNLVPDTAAFTTVNATSLNTTGNVVVGGDLTVNGTTVTLNTQTLDVEDTNITVNVNGNDVSAEGAGLTVNRAGLDGSLIYKGTSPTKFAFGELGFENNAVDEVTVQTLQNKRLSDASTSIVDSVDITKQIKFNAAGTTATSTTLLSSQTTNKILTLPDATDTLVARDTTETLNNKTLSYLKATVADELTTGANATLAGSSFGVLRLVAGGLTTIAGIDSGLAGQQITVENVTGNSIDILDDDSAAAVGDRIYTGTATAATLNANASFIFTYDAVNSHWMLTGGSGSGSGSGGVNFIPNGNAEQTATPFSPFPFIASGGTARPSGVQNSSGGNFTAVRTLSNPLAGDASWLITKGASIVSLGANIAIPFVVEPAYKAKSVKISFDYRIFSGTFQPGSNIGTVQDSTLIVYIYDLDNARFIEPSNFRLLSNSTTIADNFQAEFQTDSVSSNYQLLFSVAVSSATSCQLLVDNIAVSPNEYVFGTPVSDEFNYGPITVGAVTTAPTKGGTRPEDSVVGSRVGDHYFFTYNYRQTTAGVAGSGDYLYSLPAGLTFDLNKVDTYIGVISALNTNASHTSFLLSSGGFSDNTNGQFVTAVVYSATQFRLLAFTSNNSGSPHSNLNSPYSNTNLSFKISFRAPISGLSSSVQMSDQTSTRVVAASYFASAGGTTSTTQSINFNSKITDTHEAATTAPAGTGTWKYTAPAAGEYKVSGFIANSVTNNIVSLYKNGVIAIYSIGNTFSGGICVYTGTIKLVAGDFIDIRTQTSSTWQGGSYTAAQVSSIYIERISGPSQIAASELVAASYYSSANHSVSATVQFNFDTKEYDTHGAVATGASAWKFTAPSFGIYHMDIDAYVTAGGTFLLLYKNGTAYKNLSGTGTSLVNNSTSVLLNAGDFIEVRPNIAATAQGGALTAQVCKISITRRGP